jgi:hypothetical protein
MIAPPKGTRAFAPLFTDHDTRRHVAVLQLRAIPARRNPVDSRRAITPPTTASSACSAAASTKHQECRPIPNHPLRLLGRAKRGSITKT